MLSAGLLNWFTSDQGLMAVLAQNWLLGTLAIAAIIFVETGLVVMPFLPGDSLLFAAGAFLGISGMSLLPSATIFILAAVAGDAANYAIGRSSLGRQIVSRGWVKPHHLAQTRAWFDRFGGPTITIGRFVPIVRTVAPFLAGLSGMKARQFFMFNILGGVVWCGVLTSAGYWLGKIVWVREHLHWLSLGIVVLSVLPVGVHLLTERRKATYQELAHASAVGRR